MKVLAVRSINDIKSGPQERHGHLSAQGAVEISPVKIAPKFPNPKHIQSDRAKNNQFHHELHLP